VTEPIFRREGDAFVPTAHARGPWDPGQLHGGAPGALLAQALAADGYLIARLTFDFLGPVPLAPLRVATETTRPGRNLRMARAWMSADGRPVLEARAVLLRRASVELPPLDGDGGPPAGLDAAVSSPFPANPGHPAEGFHTTGMEIRFAGGTDYGTGPALAWFALKRPLVDDEPPTPVARVVAAADFGNGVSRVLDFERYLFINTDLTVHLHREPDGEWVLLDARTRVEPHGAGLARSALYDERGRLGLSAQSLFVSRRQ
jgi:acyl-Coa thioesterase superfamily protein/acyl-CoA thioesterase superfamily protein